MFNSGLPSQKFWVYMYIYSVCEVWETQFVSPQGGWQKQTQMPSRDIHSQPRPHRIPTERIKLNVSSQSRIVLSKPK